MAEVKLKNLVCIEMQTTAASQVTKSHVKSKSYTKVKNSSKRQQRAEVQTYFPSQKNDDNMSNEIKTIPNT